MGDLRWPGEAAQLQRELKGATALGRRVARALVWSMYWAILMAVVAFSILQVACFFVIGSVLIGLAVVQAWVFVDDPAPGLRGVRAIVDVVFGVGVGTLIAGSVIWLALRLAGTAIAWTRGLGPGLLRMWSEVTGLRP